MSDDDLPLLEIPDPDLSTPWGRWSFDVCRMLSAGITDVYIRYILPAHAYNFVSGDYSHVDIEPVGPYNQYDRCGFPNEKWFEARER